MTITGQVFNIQRFCIHDGPGIRTTVFFKRCPLRCLWCHNPESIRPEMQISFMPERCIACGACLEACDQGAHAIENGRHLFDRRRCRACGTCVAKCVTGALETVGRKANVEEVLNTVRRDVPFQDFERVFPLVDLFLYDVKETDPVKHKTFTGVSNDLILANLRTLHASKAHIILRVPVIPGFNDRDDHLQAMITLLKELPRIIGVAMIPYHAFGEGKRRRMGMADARRLRRPFLIIRRNCRATTFAVVHQPFHVAPSPLTVVQEESVLTVAGSGYRDTIDIANLSFTRELTDG